MRDLLIILKISFIIIYVIFFSNIFLHFAQAAPGDPPVLQIPIPNVRFNPAIKCTTAGDESKLCINWIAEYIAGIYKYAIGIVGILATVVMMIGGIMWMMSGGNASTASEAKSYITASLTGLIIMLSSYAILYQVNPNLISLGALKITPVTADLTPGEAIASFTGGDGAITGTSNVTSDLSSEYNQYLKNASLATGIDCTMLKAIVYAESSGKPDAKSPVGATGLMQLMPATGSANGCLNQSDLLNAQSNVQCGSNYVKKLIITACNGAQANDVCAVSNDPASWKYVIAAYNGGPKANSVSKTCPGKTYWECEANAGYQETRNYVPKVLSNYQQLTNKGWGCN